MPSLSPDEILIAEFEYIAASAFQANEDRSKATSFFVVSVGSLIATIFGAQLGGGAMQFPRALLFILTVVFLVLSLFGVLTLLQLARLRLAWHEAARAMNQIKSFYLAHFPDLEAAFRWREETLPPPWKTESISFYMALEVSLVTGMTFAAAVFFFQHSLHFTRWLWPLTVLSGGLAGFLGLFLYHHKLSKR
ncbi:MAG: hypothetical protein WHS87_07560 [Anaerolineales bacterium]